MYCCIILLLDLIWSHRAGVKNTIIEMLNTQQICHCVLCYFVLHNFLAGNGKFVVYLAFLLLYVFYIRLMRPNKVKISRGLLTCNRLFCGTVWMLVFSLEQIFYFTSV